MDSIWRVVQIDVGLAFSVEFTLRVNVNILNAGVSVGQRAVNGDIPACAPDRRVVPAQPSLASTSSAGRQYDVPLWEVGNQVAGVSREEDR